jgi:hypothetical protein
VLRGDPTSGGYIDVLSRATGILRGRAYCWTPENELVFLSKKGLFGMLPGSNQYPRPISEAKIPNDLKDIDDVSNTVILAFDTIDYGVHIFVTNEQSVASSNHWYYDWRRDAFWRVSLPKELDPMSVLDTHEVYGNGRPIFGTRNGELIYFRPGYGRDLDNDMTSYVLYGPISLGAASQASGLLSDLIAAPADESGDITWEIYAADTAEEAYRAVQDGSPNANGTWSRAALNYNSSPRVRGGAMYLKLAGDGLNPWAIEHVAGKMQSFGFLRRS